MMGKSNMKTRSNINWKKRNIKETITHELPDTVLISPAAEGISALRHVEKRGLKGNGTGTSASN